MFIVIWSEDPVVYWIQVLGDQNLIYATIGNKIFFSRWAIQAHVSLSVLSTLVSSTNKIDTQVKTIVELFLEV